MAAGATLLAIAFVAMLVAPSAPGLGRVVLWLSLPVAGAVLLWHGVFRARRDVGDDARTARWLSSRAPELDFDLLAAVELSKALGERHDFSPELARAFLRDVGRRANAVSASALLDRKGLRLTATACVAVLLVLAGGVGLFKKRALQGFAVLTARPGEAAIVREPITGDVTLVYRYPAYTGLESRTVEGSRGEVRALPGTEVQFETRADRDVSQAVAIVNGVKTQLERDGRTLKGRFVVDQPGEWSIAFVDGKDLVAQGPAVPIVVDPDVEPQVRLTQPVDTLELDPQKPAVPLGWDAKDDFGLAALELVYRAPGKEPQRVALGKDEGRSTQGRYQWDLGPLALKPGQKVEYFLEVRDTDTVRGPKKGVSRTQVVTIYSAAEHRRVALEKASALWERLVSHLADRLESPDRGPPPRARLLEGSGIDERGALLAREAQELGGDLLDEKDAPQELATALSNAGVTLAKTTKQVVNARGLAKELTVNPETKADFALQRLASAARQDADATERSVLYLENLLDRQKLQALREVAEELRRDRRELSQLLEKYRDSKDPQMQAQLLEQMQQLRQRMAELAKRMTELAKGIRDEHLNREALQEMMSEQSMKDALDEMESLIKEGKADEALQKMQELSMELDQMLENIDDATQDADQQADPELAKAFQEFQEKLDETARQQGELERQANALDEQARAQAKQRIQQQGERLRAQLLEQTKQLKQGYESLESSFGMQFERPRERALQEISHLEQALEAKDFDLAAEAARELVEHAEQLSDGAERQRDLDERFQNPPEVRGQSKAFAEKMRSQEKLAQKMSQDLESLFPKDAAQSPQQQEQLQKLRQGQRQLERQGEALQQQLDELGQKAPVFGPEVSQQLDQAAQKMGQAARELDRKDVRRGHQAQKGALQALEALQQQMRESQKGRRGKRGLPMPMGQQGSGSGSGTRNEKVELPPEDASPRELRQDVMDAMKQGAPDRYKELNRRYYEELVK